MIWRSIFLFFSTFSIQDYEKQTDDQSVDSGYTQVRVCLWQKEPTECVLVRYEEV